MAWNKISTSKKLLLERIFYDRDGNIAIGFSLQIETWRGDFREDSVESDKQQEDTFHLFTLIAIVRYDIIVTRALLFYSFFFLNSSWSLRLHNTNCPFWPFFILSRYKKPEQNLHSNHRSGSRSNAHLFRGCLCFDYRSKDTQKERFPAGKLTWKPCFLIDCYSYIIYQVYYIYDSILVLIYGAFMM